MLAAILELDDLPLATLGKFHVRTEGTPLVIEETVGVLVHRGEVARVCWQAGANQTPLRRADVAPLVVDGADVGGEWEEGTSPAPQGGGR